MIVMRCPRLSVDEKVELLCIYCKDARPAHRLNVCVSDHELCNRHGAFVFRAGKILNGLIDHIIPDKSGKTKFISTEDRMRLFRLEWFQKWVSDIESRRLNVDRPDIDEEVRMMMEAYAEKPRCGDWTIVQTKNGSTHKLNGCKLLEKISSSWFGDESVITEKSKRLVESSPWGMRWLQDTWRRRQAARLRCVADMCKKTSYVSQSVVATSCVHLFA